MGKRLVFCFDGTGNKVDAPYPTNVVILAASIAHEDRAGMSQIVHYDEGVGTKSGNKLLGGAFGRGLFDNIAQAYSFLVFNYHPGDEIFIFGFSRGAYTARSFAGMINYCGIIDRCFANQIPATVKFYKEREKGSSNCTEAMMRWRESYAFNSFVCDEEADWRRQRNSTAKTSPEAKISIRYIGVWDTVKTLGSAFFGRDDDGNGDPDEFEFHDHDLNSNVHSARHAVAIDERRKKFNVTLWDNIAELNQASGVDPADPDARFQQRWFPGDHGSVGGGGDVRGLSDEGFEWVVAGARKAGLHLYTISQSKVFGLQPDPLAPTPNITEKKRKKGFFSLVMSHLPEADRVGPQHAYEIAQSTVVRWAAPASMFAEETLYRPGSLANVSSVLDTLAADFTEADFARRQTYLRADGDTLPEVTGFTLHAVTDTDTLGGLAQHYLGDAARHPEIVAANATMVIDPNRIYRNQILIIPEA